MEHRLTKRELKRLHVRVCFDDGYCTHASTLDVSMRGLFLKLFDPKLRINKILRLALPMYNNSTHWHTLGMVVHIDNCGVGIRLATDLPSNVFHSPDIQGRQPKEARYPVLKGRATPGFAIPNHKLRLPA